jgi:hypothetical protein
MSAPEQTDAAAAGELVPAHAVWLVAMARPSENLHSCMNSADPPTSELAVITTPSRMELGLESVARATTRLN